MMKVMNEEQALQELSLEKLIEHCKKQCKLHKGSKMGYEHYIFLQLLKKHLQQGHRRLYYRLFTNY